MPAREPIGDRRPSGERSRSAAASGAPVPHAAEASRNEPADQQQFVRDRAALAAALDPIVTIDALGTIQSASNSVQRVLGWTPAELIGRNVNVLMPEPHHSAHDGYLSNYHATGQTNIMNRPRRFEAMRKDGSRVPIELCVSRAEVPGGGAPLFVGIVRDMSAFAAAERSRDEERVRAQQQLAEQTSALQQANTRLRMADRMASIGTLAAGLGHDMNNVLLPVRARLNALKASGDSGNMGRPEREHVDEIRKSVAYLQQLADGLHFLALDPDTEEDARGGGGVTNVAQWWAQAGTLLSKAVPKHVRVTASIPPDLPAVAVASHGLTQAVLNLVVNAGEAIPGPSERKRRQGAVRLWTDVVDDAHGRWVRLGVSDNGTGMPDEVKRRAFEMFYTTKPRGLGTGLGLALVRKVVERAGGRVEIESEVGKGTSVVMMLPPVAEHASERNARRGAVVSVADGRAGSLIRQMLEMAGTSVRVGGDPHDAEIWVVEPERERVKEATAWRSKRPRGGLVLFGKPGPNSAAAWASLRPVIIEDRDDLESVRAALSRVSAVG